MKFSQFIEDSSLSFSSPITQEEWDRITDVELENTETITFKTPSGKEVPFRKVKRGEWVDGNRQTWNGTYWFIYCSECLHERKDCNHDNDTPFCPNCGADMRGETE